MVSGFYPKFDTNPEINKSVIMMTTTHLKMGVRQVSETCFLSNVLQREVIPKGSELSVVKIFRGTALNSL
jgi:hypothetical protein